MTQRMCGFAWKTLTCPTNNAIHLVQPMYATGFWSPAAGYAECFVTVVSSDMRGDMRCV